MTPLYVEFGFESLSEWMGANQMEAWGKQLPEQVSKGLSHERFGDLKDWLKAFDILPSAEASNLDVGPTVAIENPNWNSTDLEHLTLALQMLIPWRKGPYEVSGIDIDTEWRSDWKWARLENEITPLNNRLVLDVGCGNGYHMWRMIGAGAKRVIGVDPSPRFSVQFEIIKRLAGGNYPIHLIPTPLEAVTRSLEVFDTVFSMGVLYHRRDPLEHLLELKDCLRPGGELILESLVVSGDQETCLIPENRYAKMRNVWKIPSAKMILKWLGDIGFTNSRIIDQSVTSLEEQRRTNWMRFESLADYLDTNDSSKTIEGYPAPMRAILVANKAI